MTRLLFFSRLRGVAGHSELACELPATVANVAAPRAWLTLRDPVLGEAIQAPSFRLAVNQASCIFDAKPALGAREVAFAAVSQIMDYLKTDAPIWKRKIGSQGARWIEPTAEDHARRQEHDE